jgi:SNF2 family DNA or RNA helicase
VLLTSKKVPACLRAYEGQRDRYSFPVCGDILRRLLASDPDLTMSSGLIEVLERIAAAQSEAAEIAGSDDAEGDPRLHPYQRVAVRWLAAVRRGILADEQGLGKTVEACSAAAAIGPKTALIVCPTAKVSDWAEHARRWIPGARVMTLGESADDRAGEILSWASGGGYLVTNYARAEIEASRIPAIGLLIIDEAHRARTRSTGISRALRSISLRSDSLFLLTATPTVNGAEDIWPLLDMVDHARWGSFWGFVFRFCQVDGNGYGLKITGLREGEREALERAIRPYILRREGALGLRPSEVRTVEYALVGEQRRLYDEMRSTGACSWGGQEIEQLDPLSQITRLRQLALHPGMIFEGYDGPSKLDALPGLIRERESGQVVVFTAYARLARLASERLRAEGITATEITGGLAAAERESRIAGFRSGAARVIVVTHGTGGEGLDLVEADRAIFLDMAWHPAGNEHAERRILRHGQRSDRTEVIYLHASGTIEDHVRDIVSEKRAVTLAEIRAREDRISQRG